MKIPNKTELKNLFFEFMRYAVVGGISFLVDSGMLALFKELILNSGSALELFICTAIGFIAGLITNYVLSLVFVFRKSENKGNAKSVSGFIVFTVVGIIGLGITEIGMYIGEFIFLWHYLFTKVFVAAVVLVWNYVGRKVFVFNGRKTDD